MTSPRLGGGYKSLLRPAPTPNVHTQVAAAAAGRWVPTRPSVRPSVASPAPSVRPPPARVPTGTHTRARPHRHTDGGPVRSNCARRLEPRSLSPRSPLWRGCSPDCRSPGDIRQRPAQRRTCTVRSAAAVPSGRTPNSCLSARPPDGRALSSRRTAGSARSARCCC